MMARAASSTVTRQGMGKSFLSVSGVCTKPGRIRVTPILSCPPVRGAGYRPGSRGSPWRRQASAPGSGNQLTEELTMARRAPRPQQRQEGGQRMARGDEVGLDDPGKEGAVKALSGPCIRSCRR